MPWCTTVMIPEAGANGACTSSSAVSPGGVRLTVGHDRHLLLLDAAGGAATPPLTHWVDSVRLRWPVSSVTTAVMR